VLTYFGDMDVSELREKPAGRQPIDTRTIANSRLDEVIDGVGRALKAGKLVYWICPLVEESEAEGIDTSPMPRSASKACRSALATASAWSTAR